MTTPLIGTLCTIEKSALFIEIIKNPNTTGVFSEIYFNVTGILKPGDRVVVLEKDERFPYIKVLWKDSLGYVAFDDLNVSPVYRLCDEYH